MPTVQSCTVLSNGKFAFTFDGNVTLPISAGTPAVTAYTGTPRNDFTTNIGMYFTAAAAFTVTSLGRMRFSGNTGTRTVKLVNTDNNVIYATATVDVSTGTVGAFKYATCTPVTVPAGTYWVGSPETSGGNTWGDNDGSITMRAGFTAVTGAFAAAIGDGTPFSTVGPGKSYVGVDFLTDGGSAVVSTPPTVSAAPLYLTTTDRVITLLGSGVTGNGTSVLTFSPPLGKPINQGETGVTATVPLNMVAESNPAATVSVTNNSTRACRPSCRSPLNMEGDTYSSPFSVEASALHPFGVSATAATLSDGTTTVSSSMPLAASGSYVPVRATQTRQRLRYRGLLDPSTLNPAVPWTLAITSTSMRGMGTRTQSMTVFGSPASVKTLTVDLRTAGGTGDDSTGTGLPGAPYKTLQRAFTRLAIDAPGATVQCVIELKGDPSEKYNLNAGDSGISPTTARPVIVRPAAGFGYGDINYRPDDAEGMQFRNDGITRFYDIRFDLLKTDGSFLFSFQNRCQFVRCRFTSGENPCPNTTGGSYYWLKQQEDIAPGTLFWFLDCKVESGISGISDAAMVSHVELNNIGGGTLFRNLCVSAVRVFHRGMGRQAFTVTYAGAGAAATCSKIGSNPEADGTFRLTVDGFNTDIALSFGGGTTIASLVSSINGVAGWSASLLGTGHPPATSMREFAGLACKSVTKTVYVGTAAHGDLLQYWGFAYVNVVVDGVEDVPFDEVEYPGLGNRDKPVIFIDHATAGVMSMTSFAFVNIDAPYRGSRPADPTASPYSSLTNPMSDGVVAFVSIPDQAMILEYAGQGHTGSEFAPSNLVLAANVVLRFIAASGGSGNDVYGGYNAVVHPEYDGSMPLYATDVDVDAATIFTSYASPTTYDLTPTVTAPKYPGVSNLGDVIGNPRASIAGLGFVGAYAASSEYADIPTPTPTPTPTPVVVGPRPLSEIAIQQLASSVPSGPFVGSFVVTPDDDRLLVRPTRALRVGATGGAIRVTYLDGSTGTIPSVAAGEQIDVAVTKVWATGTTATPILAWY